MNKQIETTITKHGAHVPNLRFPEFQDSPAWEEKNLNDVLTIGNGKDYKHLPKGTVPVFGTGGQMTTVGDFLYDGETVFIGRKGTINKPFYYNGKFWTVDTLFYTYDFKDTYPKFIYSIFLNINWLTYNEASGVPSLSKSTIIKIPSFFPSLPEQEKIADCLSSLDAKIEAQSKNIEALKNHKKGLMQQLFPKTGENLPRLRFPKFKYAPVWEEKRLGDVCNSISSGKTKKMTDDGTYPLLGSTGIIGKCLSVEYVGKFILIARVGANAGQVNYFIGECGISDNTLVIDVENKSTNIIFLLKLLENFNLNKLVFGSGQPLITGGELKSLKIEQPSLPEQEKIADCLSSLDACIEAHTKKYNLLKQYKKGLMQQLFPQSSEMQN